MDMTINWILERVDESPSTNEDLMARWRSGLLWEPVARLALRQTAGRGRMGRHWLSSPQKALTFSIAYPFKKGIQDLSGLSLACGLAVIKGISSATQISLDELRQKGLGLKWPNDILISHKKLAGMLIEGGQLKSDEATWLVIGIGINLSDSASLEHEIGRAIASLSELAPENTLNSDMLWLEILKELAIVMTNFETAGFEKYQSEWNAWDLYQNKICQIHQQDQLQLEGLEKGVDESGCLLIETSQGVQKIISGDVSLRVAS